MENNQVSTSTIRYKQCRYCKKEIEYDAIFCFHCSNPQSRGWYYAKLIASPTALLMVIIAAVQLFLAFGERYDASTAYKVAMKSKDEIIRVRKQVDSEFQNLSNTISKLNEESEKALLRLNRAAEFSRIIAEAPTNYQSLLRLLEISRSSDYSDFKSFAESRLNEIEENIREEYKVLSSESYIAYTTGTEFFYYYPIETKGWSIEQIMNKYFGLLPDYRALYLKFIWNQGDRFSKESRIECICNILGTEKYPMAIYMGSTILNEVAQLNKDFFTEGNEYLRWCETTKSTKNLQLPNY